MVLWFPQLVLAEYDTKGKLNSLEELLDATLSSKYNGNKEFRGRKMQ